MTLDKLFRASSNSFGYFHQGFGGTHCEIDIDECSPNPCKNGGLCTDGINGFNCTCLHGWRGDNCEKTYCALSPCENGGNCSQEMNSRGYRCTCEYGYTGDQCEVDECSFYPCSQGVCVYVAQNLRQTNTNFATCTFNVHQEFFLDQS